MKAMILIASVAVLAATAVHAEPVTKTTTVDRPNYEGTRVVSRDKAAGTVTRGTDVTRKSDGATASRDYSRTRTDTGFTASGSSTGFNGKTSSFDATRTRTDTGYTSTGTATGRNGQTYTLSGNRTRTENGYTSNHNVVNGSGATVYNRDASVSRVDGQINRDVRVTRAQGFRRPAGGRRH